jgi:hypothetical protein
MNMRCMGCALSIHQKECRKSLGCALSTGKYGNCEGTYHGLIEVLPWYLAGGTEENQDQDEIHTKYLPNTSPVMLHRHQPKGL